MSASPESHEHATPWRVRPWGAAAPRCHHTSPQPADHALLAIASGRGPHECTSTTPHASRIRVLEGALTRRLRRGAPSVADRYFLDASMAGAVLRDQRARGPYGRWIALPRSTGTFWTPSTGGPAECSRKRYRILRQFRSRRSSAQTRKSSRRTWSRAALRSVRPSFCSAGTQGLMSAVVHDAATSSL
jgi:hypothetical protein